MSTHNLCFGAKVRKIDIPLHTPVLLYKSGVSEGIIAQTCFHDEKLTFSDRFRGGFGEFVTPL